MSEYFKYENKDYDIPFLNGIPELTTPKIVALVIGFLITFITPFVVPLEGFHIQKALIVCFATLIPIIYALNGNLSMIFRVPQVKDIKIIILGLIGVMILSAIINFILTGGIANTATDAAMKGSPTVLLIGLIIQLIGEELLKLIPLMLVVAFTYKSLGRKNAIIVGIIISQLLFALVHIPAYGFDLRFLILALGVGGCILPITYIHTKNVAVPYFIHLIEDLIGLVVMLGTAGLLFF